MMNYDVACACIVLGLCLGGGLVIISFCRRQLKREATRASRRKRGGRPSADSNRVCENPMRRALGCLVVSRIRRRLRARAGTEV